MPPQGTEAEEDENLVRCIDFVSENEILVPAHSLEIRPGAYVAVLRGCDLLVIKDAQSRFSLPGGGIERGEDPKKAACRELNQETGVSLQRLLLLGVWNQYIFFPGDGVARQSIMIVYHGFSDHVSSLLDPRTLSEGDPSEGTPRWEDLREISDKQIRLPFREIFARVRQKYDIQQLK